MPSVPRRVLAALHQLFASWRFPAFALSFLVLYKLLLLSMLLAPVGDDAFGRFAEEFKIWCFGYDPATHTLQPMYVIMMLSEPVALGAILAIVWWKQLREVQLRNVIPYTAAAAMLITAAALYMGTLGGRTATGTELPFPAERLRMAHVPPDFALTDQEGKPVQLADLRGRVVVLTGVYASCGYTCPMILGQARRALASLPEDLRDDVTVVGISLDSSHDTPEILAKMAEGQQVRAPAFRLSTGDPPAVEALLDRLEIARTRNPKTGVIDHANVFLLIDRAGRLAYRLSLGGRQEAWLGSALRILAAEGRENASR